MEKLLKECVLFIYVNNLIKKIHKLSCIHLELQPYKFIITNVFLFIYDDKYSYEIINHKLCLFFFSEKT